MSFRPYIIENYIYKNKSYNGRFPVFDENLACKVPGVVEPPINYEEELDEDVLFYIADESSTINNPKYINSEKEQKIQHTF